MSGHTPGPWHVNPDNDTEVVFVEGEDFGLMGCDLYWNTDLPMTDGMGSAHNVLQANARLIAAAPDLLEALRDVLETSKDPEKGAYHMEALNARKRACAAIRKAEGGTA